MLQNNTKIHPSPKGKGFLLEERLKDVDKIKGLDFDEQVKSRLLETLWETYDESREPNRLVVFAKDMEKFEEHYLHKFCILLAEDQKNNYVTGVK